MRRSSLTLLEHWAIHESPVLPFLAPAVFAPWLYPAQHRSSHTIPPGRLETQRKRHNPGIQKEIQHRSIVDPPIKRHGAYISSGLQLSVNMDEAKSQSSPLEHRSFHCCSSSRYDGGVDTQLPHIGRKTRLKEANRAYTNSQWHSGQTRKLSNIAEADRRGVNIILKPGGNANLQRLSEEKNDVNATALEQEKEIEDERSLRLRLKELRIRASTTSRTSYISLDGLNGEYNGSTSSTASPGVGFCAEWASGIANLGKNFKRGFQGSLTEKTLSNIVAEQIIHSLPAPGSNLLQIRKAWQALSWESKTRHWSTCVLYYLEQSTTHAMKFLNATMSEPLPAPYQVADTLDVIAATLDRGRDTVEHDSRLFLTIVHKIMHHYKPPPFLSQRSLRVALQLFPQRAGYTLKMLQINHVHLHYNTLLHFALALAELGLFKESTNTLKQAVMHGADVQALRFRKVCSKLLRLSRGKEGNYQTSSSVVADLFDMGVRLDIIMYNVLLLNASEAGDSGTAWSIYRMIRDNNVEPDAYTYTIMMKMCRKGNRKQEFRYLYFELNPEKRDIHPYLVTEVLACRYHFNMRDNFDHVLRFYERHCDLRPLRELGIVSREHKIRYESLPMGFQGPRPLPCAGTIGLMLLAYVRQDQGMDKVKRVYNNFKRLIAEGDPCILPLVASTHTYNIFLKAYSRSAGSLAGWRAIIRDMEASLPPGLVNRETGASLKRAPPSAQTWNIIINGLARAGKETDTAELTELMERNKMKTDVVTWNSLVGGLAQQQKVFSLASTLHMMERKGVKPDLHTRKALLRVKNHPRLRRRLQCLSDSTGPKSKDSYHDVTMTRKARDCHPIQIQGNLMVRNGGNESKEPPKKQNHIRLANTYAATGLPVGSPSKSAVLKSLIREVSSLSNTKKRDDAAALRQGMNRKMQARKRYLKKSRSEDEFEKRWNAKSGIRIEG